MIDSASFWDKVAPKYARAPIANMTSYDYTLERTRSYIGPRDRVLELGCGTGSTALLLADAAGHITATDISPGMIEEARKKVGEDGPGNVEFHVAAADDPAPDVPPFDVVLAFNLLHLVPDLPAALGRIARQVRPGGLFISKTFCIPSRGAPLKLRAIRLILPLMQLVGKAPPVTFFSETELASELTRAGLEIVESGGHASDRERAFLVARRPA